MRVKVFRWRAIKPLFAFALLGAVAWALFAEEFARRTSEDVGTELVGARVEIGSLDIDVAGGHVTLRTVTVASPFEPMKNLFQADELVANVAPLPLLEKKVVIDRMAATGLRFGTERTTPGTIDGGGGGSGGGRARAVMQEVEGWAKKFDVPVLQLARGQLDVGRLAPESLESTRAATSLARRADSSARAWREAAAGLNAQATVDSARASIERLRGARATDLRAINDARRTLAQVKRARDRVAGVQRGLTDGVAALRTGVAGLDDARRRDYAFACGLVKLPSFEGPDIASALFAPVAIRRFQEAVYWAELGRRYMPPGLLPRADAGPKRARRAGTTVRFPREKDLPAFLLREAELSMVLGAESPRPRAFAGRLTGLTSAPALYGRPTVFEGSAPAVRVAAMLDHVRATPRDTAGAEIAGVRLPGFALPSLPVRLEPGEGTVGLRVALRGDTVRARWSVAASAVRWERDTAGGAAPSDVEAIVWRVLSGIRSLDLAADLSGTLQAPRLSVRSNADRAIADGLRAAIGEEVAAAERRVRAEVDRIAEERAAPVRARVAEVEREAAARLAAERGRVEQVERELEQRIREVTRGIRLP